jgi:hypothetical protein
LLLRCIPLPLSITTRHRLKCTIHRRFPRPRPAHKHIPTRRIGPTIGRWWRRREDRRGTRRSHSERAKRFRWRAHNRAGTKMSPSPSPSPSRVGRIRGGVRITLCHP